MKNHICHGGTITYVNATGAIIPSGSPVLVGKRLGVACGDIPVDGAGELAIAEVFEIRKAAGVIAQGATLYWDPEGTPVGGAAGSGCLTTTVDDNFAAGFAYAAAGNADLTVMIKINA